MKSTHSRRWLSSIMVLVMLLSISVLGFPSAAVSAEPYIGDVNEDGSLNSVDVRLVLRAVLHSDRVFSDKQQVLADFNGDGVYDTLDARLAMVRAADPLVDTIPLSGFEDLTNSSRKVTYTMQAEYTDTYTFSCSSASSIAVNTDTGYASGTTSVKKTIVAGERCDITVTGTAANSKLKLAVTAEKHYRRLPYEPNITVDASALSTTGGSSNPLTAAPLAYSKRDGGHYVYLNNPERLQASDIGAAIQRDKGLSGVVEVTWEHSNYTGKSVYLGYQVKNEGTTDVYITVTNVGMQVSGEWLGQQSWSKYYNQKFALPDDYFDANGNESARYEGQDFLDYNPRVFQPITYRLPAGKHMYVVGGTTYDAYNNIDVDGTANWQFKNGRCSNAVSKFIVTGGEVTGTFYCYTDVSQIRNSPKEQGYICQRDGTEFGLQYKGVDHHQGLLETNLTWTFNDATASGRLPVKVTTAYDRYANSYTTPYAAYSSTSRTRTMYEWTTNINPQVSTTAVGSDMMTFECRTTDGKTVIIDNEHADGTGAPANTGNWMVDYQENMTFVNQGSRTRYVTINKDAYGALMAMVLDSEGNVLSTKCTIRPIEEKPTAVNYEIYTVAIEPHSVKQITVNFLLMGNSYGSVGNWADLL